MRAVVLVCVCACSVVLGQDINAMQNMPKYDVRYDYLDVDAILDSKRLVRNYVDCLINTKPCTPEGKALKRILPEALRTKCVRCTERQQRTAVKVIRRLKYEYPEDWAKLASRWDPTGDFTRYFEEYLFKNDFNTIPNTGESPRPSTLPPPPPPPTLPDLVLPTAAPPSTTQPPVQVSTSPRPIILNRFGDDGELMSSPSAGVTTPRPTTASSAARPPVPRTPRPTSPTAPPTSPQTLRPVVQTRPTPMTYAGAASDAMPTRFPLNPASEIPPPYSTAMTIIDQIGHKIIRTTELVTDILRNTVRAVVG